MNTCSTTPEPTRLSKPNFVRIESNLLVLSSLVALFLLFGREASSAERLNQQMILACFRVDVDEVVRTLRSGANVNARFEDDDSEFLDPWTGANVSFGGGDWTALMALCAASKFPQPPAEEEEVWNNEARAEALLDAIPKQAIEQRKASSLAIMQILLSHGCKLQAEDCRGATSLHVAVDHEKDDLVKMLLEHGANPRVKHGIYIDGPGDLTPLHCVRDSQVVAQLLLDHGADPLAKDTNGTTAAESLAFAGVEVVRIDGKWMARRKESPKRAP
jgi:hypothetical protein